MCEPLSAENSLTDASVTRVWTATLAFRRVANTIEQLRSLTTMLSEMNFPDQILISDSFC